MRSRSHLPNTWTVLAGLCLLGGNSLAGQARWTVESTSSLAWWQMSPHLNHLWATTCPADPSWRPGESHSAGWSVNPALEQPSNGGEGYGKVLDTIHVPLYPRYKVRHICEEAIRGEIVVADTTHWTGVHGTIAVRSEALVTGEAVRDVTMHQVLETGKYPEIRFTIDSMVGLAKHGDTLVGSAVGTLTVRDVPTPIVAAVRALPDSGGLRVLVRMRVPSSSLSTLTPTLHTISLGLQVRLWQDLFMGADLVLRPQGGAGARNSGSGN